MSYKIVRMFFSDDVPTKTVKIGMSLEKAQSHCRDKETSSSTCSGITGGECTEKYGKWFDGYEEETGRILNDGLGEMTEELYDCEGELI